MIASEINICMEVSMDFIPRKVFHGLVNWFIWLELILPSLGICRCHQICESCPLSLPSLLSMAPGRAYYLFIGFWFVSEQYIKTRVHKIFSFWHCILRVWKLFYTLCTLTSCVVMLFSCSVVSDSLHPYGLQHARLRFTVSWGLLKLVSIESVMPSNHLILYCPILLWPSIIPSIRVFSNKSALHIRWWKYWSFSFSISPCNEYSGLISFRMDWLDLLAVQGTLKSLLQHYSSKASVPCAQLSLLPKSVISTWLLGKP